MANGEALRDDPSMGPKKRFPRSFGRYILEKSLSRGGMGEVLLAVGKGVHKRCVIKTIRGDLTGDDEFVGRFTDEAKITVQIEHENIIRVFDCGKVEDDYYIAMEYVHGRDLGDVLDRAYERGQPMPLPIGLYIASRLLGGLGYAHSLTDASGRHMGLVHRDISPQNILIGFDGAVKLIDFGLARTELLPSRTQGALAVGKYGYMSPEQARHERIDGRADLYSAGVMLFEVFTGDRLVDEQDQATLWQRVLSPKHRPPRSVVPELPKEVDELVMRAVAVRAEDRFRSAEEMLRFIDRIPGGRASRDDLQRYLRHLYPKADFHAPPVPNFDAALEAPSSERSMIFAASREGALSVFGRGPLAVEWTGQFDLAELRHHLRRPKEPRQSGLDAATRIDLATETTDETKFLQPGLETDRRGELAADALRAQPVVRAGAQTSYRDEEMTVMMNAPPRDLGRPRAAVDPSEAPARFPGADTDEVPMSLAPTIATAAPGGLHAANFRGRVIRERDSRDEAERERTERVRDRRDPAEQLTLHRATVGAQDSERAAPSSRDAVSPAAKPGSTKSELRGLLPGLVLLALALVLVAAALLLLGP